MRRGSHGTTCVPWAFPGTNPRHKIHAVATADPLYTNGETGLDSGEEVKFSRHSIPHLPNDGFQTDVPRNQIVSIGEVEFVIEYKSLRDKPYETRITIRPEEFMRTRRLVITDIKSTPPLEN